MDATNKVLSIIAFYLSEYDMDAVIELGFRSRADAIKTISSKIGKGNNYLNLRRDEFDALPDSASYRKGWRNRPPIKDVVEMASYLHQFSFDELTEIVKSFIDDVEADNQLIIELPSVNIDRMDEDEVERIANFSDSSSRLVFHSFTGNQRVYNRSIITQLKKLYRGCCQICGENPVLEFGTSICEAHHIEYFSKSHNNDASNIIILCPNHHRLIHELKPVFDYENLSFLAEGHGVLQVKLDYHLKREKTGIKNTLD